MSLKHVFSVTALAILVSLAAAPRLIRAQGKPATAKSLRCEFALSTVAVWTATGSAEASVKQSKLLLRFESINADEGTAELKDGSVESGITVQLAGRNLHFIQSFRSGPLYVTTVFDQETPNGKLKAVHSRHELFKTPLDGATSTPEQYYGECQVLN